MPRKHLLLESRVVWISECIRRCYVWLGTASLVLRRAPSVTCYQFPKYHDLTGLLLDTLNFKYPRTSTWGSDLVSSTIQKPDSTKVICRVLLLCSYAMGDVACGFPRVPPARVPATTCWAVLASSLLWQCGACGCGQSVSSKRFPKSWPKVQNGRKGVVEFILYICFPGWHDTTPVYAYCQQQKSPVDIVAVIEVLCFASMPLPSSSRISHKLSIDFGNHYSY